MIDEKVLLFVQKPSRYLKGEVNSRIKPPDSVRCRIALAFPDVIEIGSSHLGLSILYEIVNRCDDLAAERAFMPWPDAAGAMKAAGVRLATMESDTPLCSFDILGFTLAHELAVTNVLWMLDLGGIALHAEDRSESDPVVIGGGLVVSNPEPIAPFFDAFFFGDGEEAIVEICRSAADAKAGGATRKELLSALEQIEGIYIPSRFKPRFGPGGEFLGIERKAGAGPAKIVRRIVRDLESVPAPVRPPLPAIQPIHDRLAVEVARGCLRGCRFCQAGILYRPCRERSVQTVAAAISEGLANTGHNEVTLLSLSTGDYSGLKPLLSCMIPWLESRAVRMSLPSLRADSLLWGLPNALIEGRKTGFTLAPEAGSERLRHVINKPITDEQLLEACRLIYASGFNLIKLYFMLGLPTEQPEDIDSIVSLTRRIEEVGRRTLPGRARINVHLGVFVPKPHTPFQWETQIDLETAAQRLMRIRSKLHGRGTAVKWHDPKMSHLEGALSRGGRELAPVIETAFCMGQSFDAWSDYFCLDVWRRAFADHGLDLDVYVTKDRDPNASLPWDHMDSRVTREFLLREKACAEMESATPDCRAGSCPDCGVCDQYIQNRFTLSDGLVPGSVAPLKEEKAQGRFFYRVRFAKTGLSRFISHLELMKVVERALRRKSIPISYSQGYHPHPRMQFGPPLAIGIESMEEYFDMELNESRSPYQILKALDDIPHGLKCLDVTDVSLHNRSLFTEIRAFRYHIYYQDVLSDDKASAALAVFLARGTDPVIKKESKVIDARRLVESASIETPGILQLTVIHDPKTGGLKMPILVQRILGVSENEAMKLKYVKVVSIMAEQ